MAVIGLRTQLPIIFNYFITTNKRAISKMACFGDSEKCDLNFKVQKPTLVAQ